MRMEKLLDTKARWIAQCFTTS